MKNEDEIMDLTQDNTQATSLEGGKQPEKGVSPFSSIENNYSTSYNSNNIDDNIEGFVFGDIAAVNGVQSNYSNMSDTTTNSTNTSFNTLNEMPIETYGGIKGPELENTTMNSIEQPFVPNYENIVEPTTSNINTEFNTLNGTPIGTHEGTNTSNLGNASVNSVGQSFMPNYENIVESSNINTEFNTLNGAPIGTYEEMDTSNLGNASVNSAGQPFMPNYGNMVEPTTSNTNTELNTFSEVPVETYQETSEDLLNSSMIPNMDQPLTNQNNEVQNMSQAFIQPQQTSIDEGQIPRRLGQSQSASFQDDNMSRDSKGNITFMVLFAFILLVITFLLPYISGYK